MDCSWTGELVTLSLILQRSQGLPSQKATSSTGYGVASQAWGPHPPQLCLDSPPLWEPKRGQNSQLASREKDGKFVQMGVCKMWISLSQDVSFLTSTPSLQSELGTASPLCTTAQHVLPQPSPPGCPVSMAVSLNGYRIMGFLT